MGAHSIALAACACRTRSLASVQGAIVSALSKAKELLRSMPYLTPRAYGHPPPPRRNKTLARCSHSGTSQLTSLERRGAQAQNPGA